MLHGKKYVIVDNVSEENGWKEDFDYPDFSPELWAAKFGHNIGCGDLRLYTFPDENFESWIHRLFGILHTAGQTEALRKTLLTEEEQKIIEDQIDGGL